MKYILMGAMVGFLFFCFYTLVGIEREIRALRLTYCNELPFPPNVTNLSCTVLDPRTGKETQLLLDASSFTRGNILKPILINTHINGEHRGFSVPFTTTFTYDLPEEHAPALP